jgi:energy-coupling factor transporter ATP-binding protein EcfA2
MFNPLSHDDVLSQYFSLTKRAIEVQERVDLFLSLARKRNYSLALPLLGPPGCGKTQFAKHYPVLFEKKYGQKLRSLYIEVSTRQTRTNVSVDFLTLLGDANPKHGLLPMRFKRLVRLMEGNYDIIFIDEFHRLINSDTQRVEKEAADWVTLFLNAKICPVVMVGEMKCERVFVDSPQFEGRTLATVPMRPYDWANLSDRAEYRGLLMAWEGLLEFPKPSELGKLDCALRIYVFSRGLMRQTSHLISTAALLAKMDGSPCISTEHLADAVDRIRIGARAREPNSFRVDTVKAVKPAPMGLSEDDE